MLSSWPQERPRWSRGRPSFPQVGPKSAQVVPKLAPRAPKLSPRGAPDPPSRAQDSLLQWYEKQRKTNGKPMVFAMFFRCWKVFRRPLDLQVGLLDWLSAAKLASCTALSLQVELLRALGASKLGSRGRFGPPSEPLWVSKLWESTWQRRRNQISAEVFPIFLLLLARLVRSSRDRSRLR